VKTSELLSYYPQNDLFLKFRDELLKGNAGTIRLKGLSGSSKALLAANAIREIPGIHIFILPGSDEAAYFFNDLSNLLPSADLLLFPSSFKRSIQYQQIHSSNVVLRISVIQRLTHKPDDLIIITSPEALAEKVIRPEILQKQSLHLVKGNFLTISSLADTLMNLGFRQTDFVYEPGWFSVRGSIVDIFSWSSRLPCRLSFIGNELESIREFNNETQLSVNKLDEIMILPDTQTFTSGNNDLVTSSRIPFTTFLHKPAIAWFSGTQYILDKIDDIFEKTMLSPGSEDNDTPNPDKRIAIATSDEIFTPLEKGWIIESGPDYFTSQGIELNFKTSPQPSFNKNFDLLVKNLRQNTESGYVNFIFSDNEKQMERLRSIFKDLDTHVNFIPVPVSLQEGFIEHSLKIAFYTDHQIFDRYHRFQLDDQFARSENLTVQELTGLNPGDYVVHIDHGIGQFGGLEKIQIGGKEQEAVRLVYRDKDVLYVSIHSLHRISKFKGKDGQPPKIYKLGSGAWQKLKSSAKKKVKDIARELIRLYAMRKEQEGFVFSPDSYLQTELESSFIYEDTEDQLKATRDVKMGMEAPYPMDRLICGDVGFGKTEIAIRAAFKAVTDSKQVAVLVPTTILALQHYNTFRERLRDFPCAVDYVSRLKSPSRQKAAIRNLEEGKLDIIIGTHRLVSKDVKFKDLGLLIIDEEQKFGVSVKEKLRQMKLNVDTLTLTATPIPRTLQLSLMGARDLSVINTPPPNRHPIATELHTFNHEIIREAIYFEVGRKGQVFFIHNRVQNIGEVEALIKKICPDVSTAIAHGQMDGAQLEKVMLDFIAGTFDVLIASSIIESGLDIPNANTMIINNAHHFGLSDLHQLRGRVGRSNKKAFCYLLAPPMNTLSPEARKRLQAISEFSELGSGFYIALQDLDIRGAGNLLGAEQSGFIAEIGLETYQRILDEAVMELKEDEFRDVFADPEKLPTKPDDIIPIRSYITDCHIDTDLELLFPDEYVGNISERLRLYRILDNIGSEEKLKDFENELIDRFGDLPDPTRELLQVVRLRWLAIKMGFPKIILKKNKLIAHFITDPVSPYYQSPVFASILSFIQTRTQHYQLKETSGKLTLHIDHISSITQAIEILQLFPV
jgi:transcription-repair coupling factor (superfamily II helicase)